MNEVKFRTRFVAVVVLSAGSMTASPLHAVQQASVEQDRGAVYRIQPSLEGVQIVPVSPEEIRPGLAYSYYNQRLARRVWGFARDDGSFQYAFGEGTTLPTDRFDLQVSSATAAEILERRAPGLERDLEITGRIPAVRLSSTGQWRLLQQTSSARVFDLETGHRWEWHGARRVAVLHTFGDQWEIVDGQYRPATGAFAIVACGCGLPRAGSAAWVVRTGEPLP
jgi:hypothetical protein